MGFLTAFERLEKVSASPITSETWESYFRPLRKTLGLWYREFPEILRGKHKIWSSTSPAFCRPSGEARVSEDGGD